MFNIRPTARNVKRIMEILSKRKKKDKSDFMDNFVDIRVDKTPERQNAGVEGKRSTSKYKPKIYLESGGYGDLDNVARQANQRMAAWHYSRKSARLRIIWICSGVIIAIGITMTVYDSVRQKKKKQEQLDSDTEQEETKPLTSVGFAGLGAICLGVLGICIFIILKSKLNNSPYARQ